MLYARPHFGLQPFTAGTILTFPLLTLFRAITMGGTSSTPVVTPVTTPVLQSAPVQQIASMPEISNITYHEGTLSKACFVFIGILCALLAGLLIKKHLRALRHAKAHRAQLTLRKMEGGYPPFFLPPGTFHGQTYPPPPTSMAPISPNFLNPNLAIPNCHAHISGSPEAPGHPPGHAQWQGSSRDRLSPSQRGDYETSSSL